MPFGENNWNERARPRKTILSCRIINLFTDSFSMESYYPPPHKRLCGVGVGASPLPLERPDTQVSAVV